MALPRDRRQRARPTFSPGRRVKSWLSTCTEIILKYLNRKNIDIFDDDRLVAYIRRPLATIIWPDRQGGESIDDVYAAVRWIVSALRRSPALRTQYPDALTGGTAGPFYQWLLGPDSGIRPDDRQLITSAFEGDLALRVQNLYLSRQHLKAKYPFALCALDGGRLSRWLLRHGVAEENLKLEEIWWFLIKASETSNPDIRLLYDFTPQWQTLFPDGLTVFGKDDFLKWLARKVPSGDANAKAAIAIDGTLPAAAQIRLAYYANPAWCAAFPLALHDSGQMVKMLHWLVGILDGEKANLCRQLLDQGGAAEATGLGVNIIGHFCSPSGLRVSADTIVDSLKIAGLDVSRRNIRTDHNDEPYHHRFAGLEIKDVTLIHTQPDPFFDTVFERADLAPRRPQSYRVAYWYWELDTVPETWRAKAQSVDEIWVATEFVAAAVRRCCAQPVFTLFPGVTISPFEPLGYEALGLGQCQDRFVFLFVFQMSSVAERKNPMDLVAAFRQAFTKDQPVDLIIKLTSGPTHTDQLSALYEAARGANIHIVDRVMTRSETLALINVCDAYISLHRSEGLGLTLAEAMLLGKPTIATRYSGNLDFMNDDNSLLVDCTLVPVGAGIPPYSGIGHWAAPSLEQAAAHMKSLYTTAGLAQTLGARGRASAVPQMSLENSGARFAARLRAIAGIRRISIQNSAQD